MDSIALINTSEARIYLGSVGYITRHLSFGADLSKLWKLI